MTTQRSRRLAAHPGSPPTGDPRAHPANPGHPRGRPSINATIWARPFKADLDHWAAESGDHRWGYRHGLKLFKRIEDWQGTPNPAFRGTGGPVWVQPAADPLPMATAALDGFREVGLPVLDDLNGEREITGNGFAYMNQIIKKGRRHSMARAFLYPVLTRENVTVLVNSQVNRVLLKRNHAVGVDCVGNGQSQTFRAHREVILSTGGFNTPKLLMLSGIGNEKELRAVNVPVRVHSPEVGKNVQDHILHGGCLFEAPEPFEYRNSAANVSGYLKTDPRFELPDVSLVQIELPYASEVIAAQFPPPPNTWALCGGLVAPKSRGAVRLRSADPADRPIVDMRFLSQSRRCGRPGAQHRACALGRGNGSHEALRGARGRPRPGTPGRGARELHPQRGHNLLPLLRSLPDGQGRQGRGGLPAARQRRPQPAHRRQHHHAAHRGRADDAGLRPHRPPAGRDAGGA